MFEVLALSGRCAVVSLMQCVLWQVKIDVQRAVLGGAQKERVHKNDGLVPGQRMPVNAPLQIEG